MNGAAWHGVERAFIRGSDGARAPRLDLLLEAPLRLDPLGVAAAWGLAPSHDHSIVEGIARSAPAPITPQREDGRRSWAEVFVAAVARLASRTRRPAIALGGGLDAAAVLAAWSALDLPAPTVLTVHTGLSTYDEHDDAERIAATLGLPCSRIKCAPDALLAAVPEAVGLLETPLHGLHPVCRLLLARAARARGHDALLTGDGADAAFRGLPDLDYVPLVAGLTEAAGLRLLSPFLDDALLRATLARGVDHHKTPLRRYLSTHAALAWLVTAPKRSRPSPELSLDELLAPRLERLARTARLLGSTLRLGTDAERVGWWTLDLLVERLEG